MLGSQDSYFVIKKSRLLLAIFKISSRAGHKTGLLLVLYGKNFQKKGVNTLKFMFEYIN
jgi:hypothetical protein